MKLTCLFENDSSVVWIKTLPSSEATVSTIPGYVWNLKGMYSIWGAGDKLFLPYPGNLYHIQFSGDPKPWPFSWRDPKGFKGKPRTIYPESALVHLTKAAGVNDLVDINRSLGYPDMDSHELMMSVVKSIMPAVEVPVDRTYTNEHEMIVNSECQCSLIAVGQTDHNNNNVLVLPPRLLSRVVLQPPLDHDM